MRLTDTTSLTPLLEQYLRRPDHWDDDGTGNLTPVWVPALTAAEQASYTDLIAMSKTAFTAQLTLAEYQTLKPFLATERTFVRQSQSEFIALAQNARDRQLFDAVTALIRVQRQMMRDG
jgi:hypothetical protein